MASRGYVKEQFAWRHYYFYLTNEGIVYLREYLGLTEDVVPQTHKPSAKTEVRPTFADKGGRGGKHQAGIPEALALMLVGRRSRPSFIEAQ